MEPTATSSSWRYIGLSDCESFSVQSLWPLCLCGEGFMRVDFYRGDTVGQRWDRENVIDIEPR